MAYVETAIAVELAWNVFEERKFRVVIFIPVGGESELRERIASLVESDKLDLPERNTPEIGERYLAAIA